MKPKKKKILKSKGTEVLAEAISQSRSAMLLLQGVQVAFGEHVAYLDFKREISMLTCALTVLGLDASLPVRCDGCAERLEVGMN